ncbi:hypothetical protein BKA65DRAFT_598266 [Rhexocercosporidium sp. MPI-PUGE-AT-0058]|nr:hypothetical protein BKA65DRAFT_598266 [Rhexocercosporidium sp. MPI-PUGE-AT-0058]
MNENIPGTPTEIPLSGIWRTDDVNSQLPRFRLIPPPFDNHNHNDDHPEPPSSGKLTQSTQQATQSQPQHIDKMGAQKDMQDLLRLLTTGRNKIPMLAAMGRVKALQTANLRSITDIAAIDLSTLATALSTDEKTAKALLAACKSHLKSTSSTAGSKRAASDTSTNPSSTKRPRSAYELSQEPQTPAELEASLALPQPSADEEAIEKCVVYTNRAPLVLVFAERLLKYTMPEQPLSGRLSLAQAVVSANSRSKAVSIGIEKGKGAEEEGWGLGQPKVRILGREVSVLKRSGYEWKEEVKEESSGAVEDVGGESSAASERTVKEESSDADGITNGDVESQAAADSNGWTVSSPVTVKQSTFIARSITITSPSDATSALQTLLSQNKDLREASHNISAWRVQGSHGVLESSNDDGESGGGRHILGLMQADNIVGVLLVVTRWYGGVMLGPDRWRIMSMVSRDAISQRLRIAGTVGQDALWGLDLEGMKKANSAVVGGAGGSGMPIHRPEGARAYILKAFSSPEPLAGGGKKKISGVALDREREANLGLLLGALDIVFKSWDGHVSREELDRKAWAWYVQVRPDVAGGVAGWGGKGLVKLSDILKLRRKD